MREINKLVIYCKIPIDLMNIGCAILETYRGRCSISDPIALAIILLLTYVLVIGIYKAKPDGMIFRYASILSHLVVLGTLYVKGTCDTMFVLTFLFTGVYVLYFDLKFMVVTSILVTILNIFSVTLSITTGKTLSGTCSSIDLILVQCGTTILYCIILIITTHLSNKLHQEKEENISKSNEYSKELLQNILETVNNIQSFTDVGKNYLNELTSSAKDTLEIFDKVLLSTEINNENIMQQENIVKENKENLNNVSLIAKKGLNITDVSMENLSKTDKAIILMKEKSNSIVSTNKEVLDKIKEFVENVNNVKKSTQGIESISTQTSLLSLNASIESSRAGETGRGFAVVASEVRNLADQTIVLTKSINEVVSQLEIEAKETQDIVNSIVDEVSNEDVIIEAVNETYTKLMNSVIDISKKASIINEDFDDINSINNEIYSEINNLIVSSKEGKKMIDNIVDIGKKNKDRALDAYSIINEINDNALNLKNNSL